MRWGWGCLEDDSGTIFAEGLRHLDRVIAAMLETWSIANDCHIPTGCRAESLTSSYRFSDLEDSALRCEWIS